MSTDEDTVGSPLNPSTSTSSLVEQERDRERERERELERNTGAKKATNLLRQQHSFEARYSSIIQRQIWETTINKDVMERQLNAYFPFARSTSLTKDGSDGFHQLLQPTQASTETKTRSLSTTPTRQRSAASLDVAKKQEQSVKKTP